jgi:chemotaxis response regulator CheB
MRGARILLGAISGEWRRLFTTIAETDPDLEICGYIEKPVDLLVETGALKPDVVVLSLLQNGEEPGICSHLLLEYPNVGVLMVPIHPGAGRLQWMVLRKEMLEFTSTESLSTAIGRILEFCGPSG